VSKRNELALTLRVMCLDVAFGRTSGIVIWSRMARAVFVRCSAPQAGQILRCGLLSHFAC